MRRRVLVIGAAGQLGQALCAELKEGYDLIEAVHQSPQAGQLVVDLGDAGQPASILKKIEPQWILIAGAFCNVDLCETEKENCYQVNVEGPRAIAEYARSHKGWVVYYSTDHVFDGRQEVNRELDPVHPLSVYAQSKLQGEEVLRQLIPQGHLIIRTAWLYGPDEARRNFILRLLGQLSEGKSVTVPMDQWGSPTFTGDIARITRLLLEKRMSGTYHAAGPDYLNRLELAQRVCAFFGLESRLIQGVSTVQLHQAAPRPLKVRLDCSKLRLVGGGEFVGLDQGLEMLKAWLVTQSG